MEIIDKRQEQSKKELDLTAGSKRGEIIAEQDKAYQVL